MAFYFTIPAEYISTGVPVADTDIVADRQLNRASTQRELVASFGDGYEQRIVDGINPKDDKLSISFANRSAEEVDLISAFFDLKAAKSFSFFIPRLGSVEELKVVCSSYNTIFIHENYQTCTAQFRRVYEP